MGHLLSSGRCFGGQCGGHTAAILALEVASLASVEVILTDGTLTLTDVTVLLVDISSLCGHAELLELGGAWCSLRCCIQFSSCLSLSREALGEALCLCVPGCTNARQ